MRKGVYAENLCEISALSVPLRWGKNKSKVKTENQKVRGLSQVLGFAF
jgi:hypothetical protein